MDVNDKRLQRSKTGADFIINPSKENTLSIIKDITSGLGADCSLEASSSSSRTINQMFKNMRKSCLLVKVEM